ncbi:MAG: DUF4136 domain-containing protein [Chitinophagaceae bacterium]|nr:DUF4136 domain-containing protein [Chitinophagaceae bacterium]
MRHLKLAAMILLSIAVFNSCLLPYPDDSELYADVATVTSHDADQDFSKFNTYSISDTVYFIGSDSTLDPIQAQYSTQIVGAIVSNMNSRGYTRVEKARILT